MLLQYFNNVRFDLTPSLTSSGQGVAYITDSSLEGQNAIVVVDLGSFKAWRHLMNIPATQTTEGFVPTVWSEPVVVNGTSGAPIANVNFGADGIALSTDGHNLYFSATDGRELYAVPAARLFDDGPKSEILARASPVFITGKGLTDGMETYNKNSIHMSNIEDNSFSIYTPATGLVSTFAGDARVSWTDTFSAGTDGYLYCTKNQLWRLPDNQGGVDRRVKPYVLFRTKLPGGGTKVQQPAPR